jgi:hypothetical protein
MNALPLGQTRQNGLACVGRGDSDFTVTADQHRLPSGTSGDQRMFDLAGYLHEPIWPRALRSSDRSDEAPAIDASATVEDVGANPRREAGADPAGPRTLHEAHEALGLLFGVDIVPFPSNSAVGHQRANRRTSPRIPVGASHG